MNFYLGAFKKYAQFSGRASRKEFWIFIIFHFGVMIILSIIDVFLGLYNETLSMGIVGSVYLLASFVPYLAIMCRRLHDIGKDGSSILLGFVPVIGLYLIYLLAKSGVEGDNVYGQNPLKSVGCYQSSEPEIDKEDQPEKSVNDNTMSKVAIIAPNILFCRKCGVRLPSENSLYCNRCGTKIV